MSQSCKAIIITNHVSGTSVSKFRTKRKMMLVGPEPVSQERKKSKSESKKDLPRQGGQGIIAAGKREQGHRNGKGRQEWEFRSGNERHGCKGM